ncbi:hypothetical protein HUG17_8745 [Dermatophagoides farinae]|uniref:RING-type domain-containing protein n=1 Tax=Dermatophagoides farinae TaxID=6954 RepID=A0A9D4SDC6_DERFA|nr:E3 ISG15--protein ligase HERC5-like [Dermatophagoides farinae]KAH7637641.1 hypothetical protein HUG17_8745 [Dermatophagoides farinae]
MDVRQSRISKYYSSSLDQWNRKLFDRLTNRNFRQSVRYVIFLHLNDSFIIITKNWRTFVYGPQVCAWLGLPHENSLVNEILELRYTELKQVDYGDKFFVVLTANGSVCMASRKSEEWRTYRQLQWISNQNYRMISCGLNHILLLREDGKLFTMGDNRFGQLGRNDIYSSFIHMIDTGLSHVERIACGSNFSIAITSDEAYSWGLNNCGQLGIENVRIQFAPAKMFNYDGRVVNIVAGASNIWFLMGTGNVHQFGHVGGREVFTVIKRKISITNIEAIACEKFGNFAIFFKSNGESYVLGRKNLHNYSEPKLNFKVLKTFDDVYQDFTQTPHSFIPTFLNNTQLQQSNGTNGSTVPTTSTSTSPAAATTSKNISINNNNDRSLCSICLDRERQIVFFPCCHLTSCSQCSTQIDDCPICRKNIDGHLRVYLS